MGGRTESDGGSVRISRKKLSLHSQFFGTDCSSSPCDTHAVGTASQVSTVIGGRIHRSKRAVKSFKEVYNGDQLAWPSQRLLHGQTTLVRIVVGQKDIDSI